MTFQDALKYFVLAPFQPRKVFLEIGVKKGFETRTINYLLAAVFFWYFGLLMLFPFRYIEFYNYLTLMSFLLPILFLTFGYSFALGAVSNFTMKNRLSKKMAIGLVAISFFPFLLTVPLSFILPQYSMYITYGCEIWTAVIIANGIKTLRLLDFKIGLSTSVIGLLLVIVASKIAFSFLYGGMI